MPAIDDQIIVLGTTGRDIGILHRMGMTLCESCPRLYLRFGGVNCNPWAWREDADSSVSVIREQRLRSWLQIRVNMPVNNKASVIEKPFIHSFTNNKQCLNGEARSTAKH